MQSEFALHKSSATAGVDDPATFNLIRLPVDFNIDAMATPFVDRHVFDFCFVDKLDPAFAAKVTEIIFEATTIQLITRAGSVTLAT